MCSSDLGAVDDAVGADDATQVGEERGPDHVAFLLAPALRRVQRAGGVLARGMPLV